VTAPTETAPSSPTTLYRFFDAEGQLLYVGITRRGANRWRNHEQVKAWWGQVSSSTVEHVADHQPDRSDQIVRLGDLLDARQVATLLGLSRSTGVAVYRSARKADGSLRHPDFPQPVLPCDGPVAGASYYWLLQDVVTFLAANPGLARKARDAGTPPS
jgi:predicted DNA-binding transcriptional regulator AlpA